MRKHPENPDLELALRRSLHEHARQAPAAGPVAERILATLERPAVAFAQPLRRSRAWRTWALPLLAAGAAAAVVGAVAVVQNQPEAGVPPVASPTSTAPTTAPVPSPTRASTAGSSTTSAHTTGTAAAASGTLSNVRLLDITFDGVDDGWALASSSCLSGAGRCSALLRTTDGTTWTSIAGTPFNVPGVNGCAAPCVQHLRFATSQIGYAFGPDALFLTQDGARTWQRQPGGAEALETLDGNVIRVVSDGSGCPGPCGVRVELAGIGRSAWTTVHLVPGDLDVVGLAFTRGTSGAYLLAERNPAGGADNATSTLYTSADDGVTWHAAGEPCPQPTGGEADSSDVAGAPGHRVAVLCTPRFGGSASFVATSTDGGRTAVRARGAIPIPGALHLAGDPRTVLAVGGEGLACSHDGGATWTAIPYVTGAVTFVGFESAEVGRVIAADGQALWTTRDGGATWTRATFR